MWKLQTEVTHITGVIKSLCQSPPQNTWRNNVAANCYECGQLFRWYQLHHQNSQNADEIDSAGDTSSVELDSQAKQWNQTEVLPTTTTLKWKAASME